QTIMVTHGEIPVNKNLSISALGLTANVVLNGSHSNRLFNVSGGVTATLDSLSLTNGYPGAGNSGGAILNYGALTMNRCAIAGSSTDGSDVGGAMVNNGTLLMTACTLSGNTAQFSGAIQNNATCSLVDCTLAGNTASANGGAIDNVFGATLNL